MNIVEISAYTDTHFNAAQKLASQLAPQLDKMTREQFEAVIESKNSHLFFIFKGSEIAGMLTICFYDIPTGKRAWIEDVVIDDDFRGLGLGKAIVSHALDYAREKEVKTVMLTSNPSRIAANGLYPSMGFKPKTTNLYTYELVSDK